MFSKYPTPFFSPIHRHVRRVMASSAAAALLLLPFTATAWDAVGHRLSADVAWALMSADTREQVMTMLRAHPRFNQDFVDTMPDDIKAADNDTQAQWQLGQAAIWPDLARGFEGDDEARFDNPNWHWIDGAWLRDEAVRQGNVYVNTEPFPNVDGVPAEQIQQRSQVDNVANGLDFAIYQLQNASDPAEKAVALSWLLHLIGDIHQPLHTGALVSESLFPEGDRGGNGIRLSVGNLHSAWDRALRETPVSQSLPLLINMGTEFSTDPAQLEFHPTRWLQESRDILQSTVYPESITSLVVRTERTGNDLETVALTDAYQEEMRIIATRRLAEAGARIAHTLENL
jgi:hypothetical protein